MENALIRKEDSNIHYDKIMALGHYRITVIY
jgi:hypothetical protein